MKVTIVKPFVTQWCLGIEEMKLSEDTGFLTVNFYPHIKDLPDSELKRFVLALAEFVKDYK